VFGILLASWVHSTSRRVFEIGILLAGIGAGVIGLGALVALARRSDGFSARGVAAALLLGSVLLVAGFVLMILAVHFGVSPFRSR
jgi:hypothetical protein